MDASPNSPAIRCRNADRHRSRIGAWLASYDSQNTRAAYRRDIVLLLRHLDVHDDDVDGFGVGVGGPRERLREGAGWPDIAAPVAVAIDGATLPPGAGTAPSPGPRRR